MDDTGSAITSGGGNVSVTGLGGGSGASDENIGVLAASAGQITAGGAGTVTVMGTGGATSGGEDAGVYVYGTGSAITSGGGNVSVTGLGGGSGTAIRISASLPKGRLRLAAPARSPSWAPAAQRRAAMISEFLWTSPARHHLRRRQRQRHRTGGGTGGFAIELAGGSITTATNGGTITLNADSMDLRSGSINAGSGNVTLEQLTNGTLINLGGADTAGTPATLGLTNAELGLVTAGTLTIGDGSSGTITITAAITWTADTNIDLDSGGAIDFTGTGNTLTTDGGNVFLTPGIAGVSMANSGVDIDMDPPLMTAGTLSFANGTNLNIAFNGTTVDSGYDQLNVMGMVNLTGVNLVLSGTLTPQAGQTFTIVNNDGTDAIMGMFNGRAEGATIPNFLGSGLSATISYMGGDGNDVVLTVVTPASGNVVSDSGTHTLTIALAPVLILTSSPTARRTPLPPTWPSRRSRAPTRPTRPRHSAA